LKQGKKVLKKDSIESKCSNRSTKENLVPVLKQKPTEAGTKGFCFDRVRDNKGVWSFEQVVENPEAPTVKGSIRFNDLTKNEILTSIKINNIFYTHGNSETKAE
jgi:hypothetical protein